MAYNARPSASVVIDSIVHIYHKELRSFAASYNCSYHLAEKKIPSIHGQTMGLKMEQFIFDAFPYAPSTALFEVKASLFPLLCTFF